MDSCKQVKILVKLLEEAEKEIKKYKRIVEYNLILNTDKYQLKLWEERKNALDEELEILYKILQQRKKKYNIK